MVKLSRARRVPACRRVARDGLCQNVGMRSPAVALTALVLALSLAACAPQPAPQPTSTATTTPSATAEPQPTTEPFAGAPLAIECSALVTDQAMYDYNPNYGLDDTWRPVSGTLAAKAVALGGTACAWRNETGGELLIVAAAHPSDDDLAGLSTGAPFAVAGDTGTAQSFDNGYWVVTSSTEFLEAADAAPIVTAANAALR